MPDEESKSEAGKETTADNAGKTASEVVAAEAAKAAEATKTTEAKAGEQKKEEAKKEPEAKGAPEQYADFTLPEGVTLDAALSDSFKATSKELGLPQDKAQKLVDLYAKSTKAAIEGQLAEFAEQQKGWKEATLKALGANADKELAFAAKARDAFGSPELAKLLEETKLGDRIEIVQMLIKAGKAISEGGFVEGKPAGQESKSFADALYGKPAAK